MRAITVPKEALVNRITANKNQHEQIFEEAVAGYKEQVVQLLEDHIKDIKKGRVARVTINLPQPENHIEDYDRILDMLTMDTDDTVVLDEDDFAQYVRDDWSWKRQFITANASYSTTAQRMSERQ